MIRRGSHTPWGAADHVTPYGDDGSAVFASTPSHGGFWIAPALLATMPASVLNATFGNLGQSGWFEEDEDAAYVIAAFPDRFDSAKVNMARTSLVTSFRHWEANGLPWEADKGAAKIARQRAALVALGIIAPAGWEQVEA